MKKKWTVRPQELWNPVAIEQWLEHEAAKGWKLHNYNGWFAVMERMEPISCRVRLQPHGPEETNAWKERVAAYEEMGWEYLGSVGRSMDTEFEAYCCSDPAIPELYTDPVVYALAWEEQLRWGWWSAWLLLLIPLLVPGLIALAWKGSMLQMVLSMPMALLYALLVLCPMLLVMAIRQLRGIRKLRRLLAAGVKPDRSGNWKRDRLWWRVVTWMILGYWMIYLGTLVLDLKIEPDIPNPFVVSETTLLPESRKADWNVEEFFARRFPLRPLEFRVRMCYIDQQRIQNNMNCLQFEFLAEMLYQEIRTDFLKEWPEGTQISLEIPNFDEAVLLAGGENVQMLLVRSGKIVYSLWVNFPVELQGRVDALLPEW